MPKPNALALPDPWTAAQHMTYMDALERAHDGPIPQHRLDLARYGTARNVAVVETRQQVRSRQNYWDGCLRALASVATTALEGGWNHLPREVPVGLLHVRLIVVKAAGESLDKATEHLDRLMRQPRERIAQSHNMAAE